MDEAVKTIAVRLAAPLLAICCVPAFAQALQDPTRPPASILAGQAPGGGRAATLAAPVTRAPQLQSVLVARQPGGRHIAVIDGETVRVGDLVRGARVTRIDTNEVELSRGRSRQVLKLHAPAAGAARSAGIERVRQE